MITNINRVFSDDVNKKMAFGAFWSIIGTLVPKGLMLGASILLARILGQESFGELSIVRSTVSMFTVFAVMGLSLTATKYIAQYVVTDKDKIGNIIALSNVFAFFFGSLIGILLISNAKYICTHFINAPQLVNEVKLGGLMLFFNAINASQNGILVGFEKFKVIAINNCIAGIISTPLEIWGAWNYGILGALVGTSINFILLWLLNIAAIRKIIQIHQVKVKIKNCVKEISILWKFTLPSALSGFLVTPVMWACNVILVNEPNGFSELALFEAANQWKVAVVFIPSILSVIALPMLVSNLQNKELYKSIFKKNLFLNFSIAFLIALLLSLFTPFLMKLYGKSFLEGKSIMIILMFSTVFMAVNSVIGQVITSKGQMWIGLLFNFLWGVSLLLFSLLFIYNGLGALGLSLAFFCSYLLHCVWQYAYIWRIKW